MSFDSSKILAGLSCLISAIVDKAERGPLRTVTIPRFEMRDQAGSFSLLEETGLFWAAIVNDAYAPVAENEVVEGAVKEIGQALPAEVRDTQYGWLGPVGSAAACAFQAFCEIAVAGPSPTMEVTIEKTEEAIEALERFARAERHRAVHAAAVYGVELDRDLEIAPNVFLRPVDDGGRQDV